MKTKRMIVMAFGVIFFFLIAWLSIQYPEMKKNPITGKNYLRLDQYNYSDLMQDSTLLLLVIASSFLFWKWELPSSRKKSLYYFTGIFSAFSIIIIAVKNKPVGMWILGFVIIFTSSILISVSIHIITILRSYILWETLKSCLLGILTYMIFRNATMMFFRDFRYVFGDAGAGVDLILIIGNWIVAIIAAITNLFVLGKIVRGK